MNVDKNRGVSFGASIKLANPKDAQNSFLKPIINQLESVGGDNVEHYLDLAKDGYTVRVTTKALTKRPNGEEKTSELNRVIELLSKAHKKLQFESINNWLQKPKP